ncbi:MAG TPA: tetratricopeptide repeat protein [bacterium]|nr:tetratricopeptide repeat protein [bacterium]HPN42273.1 tetratricopeptide repeat protein [bacterium]
MKTRHLVLFVMLAGLIAIMACQTKEVTSAKVYIQQDNWEKAIEQLEMAVKMYPNDPEAHYLLGEGYANKGEWEKMNDMFEKSLAIAPTFATEIKNTREKNWVSTFNSGVARINGNDLDGAQKQFLTCIIINPKRVEAYRNLAIVYTQKSQVAEAVQTYEKAIALDPANLELVHALAGLHFEAKEYQKVVDLEKAALEKNPNDPDAIANIALAYDLLGEKELARDTYVKALEKNPNDKDLLFNLARLYYLNEDYANAIETFNKVIALSPDDFDSNVNVGNAYLSMADAMRKKLVDKENDNQTVSAEEKDGLKEMYGKAIPYLEKALTIKDTDPNLWNNLGVAYVQAGNTDKGTECFKKSEELSNK